ncbi:hypothetical protein [Halovivax gelatinilyticus]|uniref:hypothetical protein n=1 Tax=Halovivax gelatinilyticus TaxID=2961597 RepID=UPI0020CA9542|nr:hypothetical protein [Halovivax gelatinilyticus]
MHPSKLFSALILVVSLLLVIEAVVAADYAIVFDLQLIGGIVLGLTALVGLARYEEDPIVTEYHPVLLVVLFFVSLWILLLLYEIVLQL